MYVVAHTRSTAAGFEVLSVNCTNHGKVPEIESLKNLDTTMESARNRICLYIRPHIPP